MLVSETSNSGEAGILGFTTEENFKYEAELEFIGWRFLTYI